MSKKILIAISTYNNISDNISDNLLKNGYKPYFYPSARIKKFTPTLIDKIINIFLRTFFPKLNFIKQQENKHKNNFYNSEVSKIENLPNDFFDFTVIFRADTFSNQLIDLIKSKSKKVIAYQWDGLDRYPEIYSKINLFDNFFCFDPKDCDNYNFITNFYFDYLPDIKIENEWDITYIGYYSKDRFELLENIAIQMPHKKINFVLTSMNRTEQKIIQDSKFISFIEDVYDYSTLLDIHNKSKIILDIKAEMHDGLSFRFFEAMQLNKKIITTNESIKKYDFYTPKNIFVINENLNFDELNIFVNNDNLDSYPNKYKYSFTNWFKNLIDDKTKIKIDKPK